MNRGPRPSRRAAIRAVCAAAAAGVLSAPASAFDSKGHVVIEALAYRSLIEGHDGRPPQPDVLKDLFNDGDLAAPICFGLGSTPPAYCADAAARNPLLAWPQPRTDEPDAAFRRQFSDPGQCFHFMATLEDAQSERIPGTEISRALAVDAVVRCRDLLDGLLRQIVIDGGPGTRRSAYGLYELMHAIGDSFSGAHSARRSGGREIEYLRVWKPLEKIAHIPTERSARIPSAAYHKWDDHRDKDYVDQDRVLPSGRRCKDVVDFPYEVPYECLAEPGDQARLALVELLVLVRDLRLEHRSAGAAADANPERSPVWLAYKDRWFSGVYVCQGAECQTKQPADLQPGAYGLVGISATYNPTRGFLDTTARAALLRYSSELNPFVYGVHADLGFRRFDAGGGAGLFGLGLDLVLPLGKRASLGFTPAVWRLVFDKEQIATDLASRFFLFSMRVGDRLFLTVNGPIEVNWRKPAVEWSFGVGLAYAPGRSQSAAGAILQRHSEKVDRRDDDWSPPAAPYGRLLGRTASLYVTATAMTVETPEPAVPGRLYGLGSIGGNLMWDRDRWGGRFEWSPALGLAIGSRRTSGESTYLTGTFAAGVRWYALGVLGLSLTAVRVEGGPKIHGQSEDDHAPDIHGAAGSQHYLQEGSRLGIAFNAGIIDLLVEAPTLAWRSHPFNAGEILTFSLSIRLN